MRFLSEATEIVSILQKTLTKRGPVYCQECVDGCVTLCHNREKFVAQFGMKTNASNSVTMVAPKIHDFAIVLIWVHVKLSFLWHTRERLHV